MATRLPVAYQASTIDREHGSRPENAPSRFCYLNPCETGRALSYHYSTEKSRVNRRGFCASVFVEIREQWLCEQSGHGFKHGAGAPEPLR